MKEQNRRSERFNRGSRFMSAVVGRLSTTISAIIGVKNPTSSSLGCVSAAGKKWSRTGAIVCIAARRIYGTASITRTASNAPTRTRKALRTRGGAAVAVIQGRASR